MGTIMAIAMCIMYVSSVLVPVVAISSTGGDSLHQLASDIVMCRPAAFGWNDQVHYLSFTIAITILHYATCQCLYPSRPHILYMLVLSIDCS
jgi:Na+/proline symporter